MGEARFVGRVGALAVALGIGVAVTNTPGITWADSPATDGAPAPADSAPADSGSGTAPSPPGTSPDGDVGGGSGEQVSTIPPADADSATTTIGGGDGPSVTISYSGGYEDEDTLNPRADDAAADVADAADSIEQVVPTSVEADKVPQASPDAQSVGGAPEGVQLTTVDEHTHTPFDATMLPQPPADRDSAIVSLFTTYVGHATDTGTAHRATGFSALHAADPDPATDPVSALFQVPATLIVSAVNLGAAIFEPIVGPGAPLDNAFLWGLLAWVRRETNRTLANETPVLNPHEVTLELDEGQTSGPLTFSAHDDDPLSALTFTPTGPGTAGGTLTVTGNTYTYTPRPDWQGRASYTDTFTVTISDAGRGFHIHAPGAVHTNTATVTVHVTATTTTGPPTVGEPSEPGDPDAVTGAVSGSFVVTDGGSFTVDVLQDHGAEYGSVAFDVDAAAGIVTYTYRPTLVARLRAGLQEIDTDGFTAVVTTVDGDAVTVDIDDISVAPAHLETQAPILTGGLPAGMVIVGDRLYVADAEANTVTVVDLAQSSGVTFRSIASLTSEPETIAVDQGPTFLVAEGNRLYVTSQLAGTVSVIDIDPQSATYHSVLGDPIPIEGAPTGVAASGDHLYVTSLLSGTVSVIDIRAATLEVVKTITVGAFPVDAVAVDDRVYVTNAGDRTVSVIDAKPGSPTLNSVLGQPIQIGASPFGITASADGSYVYVAASSLTAVDTSFITVIDTETNTVVDTDFGTLETDSIPLAGRILDVALSPDGTVIYAADATGGMISLINSSTYEVIDTIAYTATLASGGSLPSQIAVTPDGAGVFIADSGAGTVSKVSIVPGTVVTPNASVVVHTDDIDHSTGTVTITLAGTGIVSVGAAEFPGQGVLDGSDNGDGTYSITYTPFEQARYDAFASPGLDEDHFTLTVSNGQRIQVVSVHVPIDPKEDVNDAPVAFDTGFSYGNSNEFTGAVSGQTRAYDPDFDDMVYALKALDPAVGTVEIDPDTGGWTFTPSIPARLAAWNTSTDEMASFTIVVSDGELTTDINVSVPISPDRAIAGIEISAPGAWAISPHGDRIYIVNRTDSNIAVVDTHTNQVIHEIEVDSAPTHLAVSIDGTELYFLQDRSGPVQPAPGLGLFFSAVDTETWEMKADAIQISGFTGSTGFILSPDGKQIYVGRDEGFVTPVIDADTYAISRLDFDDGVRIGSALPQLSPENLDTVAFGPDGRLYVADRNSGSILVYDTSSLRPIGEAISVGTFPHELLMDPSGDFLYGVTQSNGVGADSAVFVVDTGLNAKITEFELPEYPHHYLQVSRDGTMLYVASSPSVPEATPRRGAITVIDLFTGSVVDSVEVGFEGSLRDFEVSPDGGRLYILNDGLNALYRDHVIVFDTESRSVIGEPIMGSWRGEENPNWIFNNNDAVDLDLSADGTRLYVYNGRHGVTLIDTGTASVPIDDSAAQAYAPISTSGLRDRLDDYTKTQTDGSHVNYAIEKIVSDGEVRLIVYAGGTVPTEVFENQGLMANLPVWGGTVDEDLTDLINRVLDDPDVPFGVEIMAVGFSQGGMEVQNLAATKPYNVTTVVSFASPISQLPNEGEYHTVHIQANGDIVPAIPGLGNDPLNPDQKIFAADAPTGGLPLEFHGNPTTYEIVGAKFDQSTDGKFTAVKENIAKFHGKVIETYR